MERCGGGGGEEVCDLYRGLRGVREEEGVICIGCGEVCGEKMCVICIGGGEVCGKKRGVICIRGGGVCVWGGKRCVGRKVYGRKGEEE